MNRKVLLSIMVIAAMLVLIAGVTYAVFTDQAMSDIQDFTAGTVNITVNTVEDNFETTFHEASISMGTGWAPGDYNNQNLTIANVGSLDVIYTVYMDYDWNPGDIWSCDPNGYNLHVWTTPQDTGVIASGGNTTVTIHAEMPLAAGNACQGKSGDLRVTVHAVQRRNIDPDFTCVKLVYKDGANKWLPYGPGNPIGGFWQGQHGNVCYKVDSNKDLRVITNAYDLTPNAYYQLALNGQGATCPGTWESQQFAGMTANLYHSGWSSGSTTALTGSCINYWDEGVYNIFGTDGGLQADSNGDFSSDVTLDGSDPQAASGLPTGTYNDVKFIVKEITGYGGSAPSHADHGSNWQPMLMEIRTLNFAIP